jgi:hypothetical protein
MFANTNESSNTGNTDGAAAQPEYIKVKIVGQVEFGYMLFITHLLYPKILGCN